MEHLYISMTPKQQWNVMRHDHDINPVTSKPEVVAQCVCTTSQPLSDEALQELRQKYNDPDMWVVTETVYQ
ncbi:hypothetical protein pEaSNUABM14_00206 [Erwinia phage pEa_SNUABM_14]|uniref:Uncharacterized protein n=1 Tax=Erwinia phage pEa_SNUABM_7 TaxID=2866695 RepID=A0AAE7WSL9_9CAUD|nr:hypothetical protein MPK74_gp207 [Erwinia phage pEa_SNUABM_7]QYW03166.1 hypothetical protein pEaSNUABM13_00207 [Erwinia phage pEa_SNUABM_13]QYW03507.1 hypothetical protein pEaSNUABM34_00205 [Erwinia phage pEa_SNUABM_34]QYW03849.1 hypothetical protein pEaSNUABM45_00206 [Erwinia phage pEa_SNUABM_45]QYW04190.1 hypothetical protein pEaSNUABM46_00206 [Erwinia phage pEa_SNUABM_46]QYW04531.1 hypothetical protein pEaSNUABM14_00206 [Erwinia phage pEa_SNUABM_14]QYW05220.1 hypothetical protein pEaSNU